MKRSVRSALDDLAARHELPEGAVPRLALLLELVERRRDAKTTVREPDEAVRVHLADSLSCLVLPGVAAAGAIVDIGSGAGFPGLPLAIALPEAWVDLVEATARKAEFIAAAIAALGLPRARAIAERAETWATGEGAGAYDLAASRAVGTLATVAEYAAPLLRPDGLLVVWKGRRDADEERRGAIAAAALGLEPVEVRAAGAYAGSRQRHLHLYRKVAQTPPAYPRRPGMARKRPLGGRPPQRAMRAAADYAG